MFVWAHLFHGQKSGDITFGWPQPQMNSKGDVSVWFGSSAQLRFGTLSFPQTALFDALQKGSLQNQHDNLYLILLGCFGPETSLLYEMNQSETLQNGFETLQNEPETLQHESKTLQNVSETKRSRTYLEKTMVITFVVLLSYCRDFNPDPTMFE